MEGERGDEQRHGDEPGAALAPQHAARQHDHADAGDGRQRAGGLDDGDGQVLRNEVQVLAQRSGDRGEQVDGAGHEQRDGGQAADAPHPDVVRRHLGGGRPGRAARPAGRQLGVDVGPLGSALDHGVGGDQPLAHGGQRQVGLGQQQADVQLRPGLDLERRLLSMVQERGRQPEAAPVLVHDLGGGAGAGEEARIEVGQLGHQRTAGDDARDPRLDGGPGGVERVLAVHQELLVGDGAGPRRAAGPRRGQAPAPERPPNAAGREGDHDGQDGQEGDGDDQCDDEAREPGGVVGALERVLLARRAEDATEAVDDELDAQQQRDGGQHQGRRPQVAAQAPVEQSRRHEATGQQGIVEALHAGQPGPVLRGRGVHRRVGVGPQRPGPDQDSPGAGPGFAVQVHAVADLHAATAQLLHQGVVPLVRLQHGDDAGVGPPGEITQRAHEHGMSGQGRGGAFVLRATRRGQAAAEDHDPGSLPLLEPAGDVTAGGQGAAGGLRREEQVADHLDPPPEGHSNFAARSVAGVTEFREPR